MMNGCSASAATCAAFLKLCATLAALSCTLQDVRSHDVRLRGHGGALRGHGCQLREHLEAVQSPRDGLRTYAEGFPRCHDDFLDRDKRLLSDDESDSSIDRRMGGFLPQFTLTPKG